MISSGNRALSRPRRALYIIAGTLIVLAGMGGFFSVDVVAGVVMAGMSG